MKNRIRECRLKALVGTQKELARMSGIHPETISALESNHVRLSSQNALRIAKALRCSLDDLFETEGNPNE